MGSLFDEIQDEKSRKGNRSRIAEILSGMSKEDQADFIKALDDHSIPASNITHALKKRNIVLAGNVISRYRRGELATKLK